VKDCPPAPGPVAGPVEGPQRAPSPRPSPPPQPTFVEPEPAPVSVEVLAPPAPSVPATDHSLQDMDLDEETPNSNITDEVSNFYAELGGTDTPSEERLKGEGNDKLRIREKESRSPTPQEVKKKKKKVKVSNNISLKKKGVEGMLAKWQNINH